MIAGHDPADPQSVDVPVPDFAPDADDTLEGLTIGVDRVHHFPPEADPVLAARFDAALAVLEGLGARIVDVVLPCFDEMLVANILTISCESLAYHRADLQARWDDYFPGTRNIFAQGALVSGADYVQAQRARRHAQRELATLFERVDAVVSPTTAIGAIPFDAFDSDHSDELDALFRDIGSLFGLFFTPYWDCVGNPVLAMPIGFTEGGLPLSMQVGGRAFDEATILRIAAAYQRQTDWHEALPTLMRERA